MAYENLLNRIAGESPSAESKTRERVDKIFGRDSNDAKTEQIKRAVNPFLDKNGNAKLDKRVSQALLDNTSVSPFVKKMIQSATGLTPKKIVNKEKKTTASTVEATTNDVGTVPSDTAIKNGRIGFISAKYESGGRGAGTVSSGSGDYGGVSYGTYQFASNTGSANSFVNWLKNKNPEIASGFNSLKSGTDAFSNAWRNAASKYGEVFAKLQDEYIYDSHVKPLVNAAKKKTGIDYTRSVPLLELVFSTAVQFGGGKLGLSALGNVNADMSDEQIINASYDKKISNYKGFFSSSSPDVQEAVKNRFINERKDVLNLL